MNSASSCREIDDTISPSLQDGLGKSCRSTWSFSFRPVFPSSYTFWSYLTPREREREISYCDATEPLKNSNFPQAYLRKGLWGPWKIMMICWYYGVWWNYINFFSDKSSPACFTMTPPPWRRRMRMGMSLFTLRRPSTMRRLSPNIFHYCHQGVQGWENIASFS